MKPIFYLSILFCLIVNRLIAQTYVRVQNSSAINVQNGAGLYSNGTITVSNNANLTNNGTITVNNGTGENGGIYAGAGSFKNGLFNNTGTVALGSSSSCATFSNGFTTSGILNVKINGAASCSQFDQFTVTGAATVGGTLSINLGFTPTSGQKFQIISASSYIGNFSSILVTPNTFSATYKDGFVTINPTAATCRDLDSSQLVALYNATNGANWTQRNITGKKSPWVLTEPMDNWYGITLNATGCVTCIDLDGISDCNNSTYTVIGNGLIGKIPSSLSNLKSLTSLYLSGNQLSDTIPNFQLPELQALFLSKNQLTGLIPNFQLPKLQFLLLYENQLSDTIPNFNLPILMYLGLGKNELTGRIPNFKLPQIKNLWLDINKLSGNLPTFDSLKQITLLQLNDNNLSGCIPQEIKTNCPNLGTLGGNILNNPNLITTNWANYWNNLDGACVRCSDITVVNTGNVFFCPNDSTKLSIITNAVEPTYMWSTGATTANITVRTGGIYSVTVTQVNGCKTSLSITVTVIPISNFSESIVTNVSCNGGHNGIIDVSGNGIFLNTYSINPNPLGSTQNPLGVFRDLTSQNYTITMRDRNGCPTTKMFTVTEPPPLNVSINKTDVTNCTIGNGSATAIVSGGTSPYTYRWSNNATTAIISNLVANHYFITITDSKACIITDSATITLITNPPSVTNTIPRSHCGTGTVTLQATASAGILNWYATSTGGTSVGTGTTFTTPSISTTTTYYVEATNNGCTSARTPVMATINELPNPTLTPIAPTCGQNNGSIAASITGGKTPYTYLWSTGATTLSITNIAGNTTQSTYVFTATDANGCTASSGIQISCNCISASTPSVAASQTSNCGTKSTKLTISSGTLNSSTNWQWYSNTCGGTAVGSDTSITVSPATTTTYYVRGEGGCANGNCASITITVNPLPMLDAAARDIKCKGNTDGAVTLAASGGTGAITFSINPLVGTQTSNTFAGLTAQTYTFTATDSKNCTATATATVSEPATNISFSTPSVTNIKCKGNNDGIVALTANGGTGAITFSINPLVGTQTSGTFTGLSAQTYTFTATDTRSCTATTTATVTQPTATISFSPPSVTNIKCKGNNDGIVALTANGGTGAITFSINPLVGTQIAGTFSGLTAQTYTFTATDAQSCTATTTATVTQPSSALSFSTPSVTAVKCNGGNDGKISLITSGGEGAITFSISPNPTGSTQLPLGTFNNLMAQTYTFTATDMNNCTTTINVAVSQPNAISFSSPSVTNVKCKDGSDGKIILSASGGVGAIKLSISPNIGSQAVTGTFEGLTAQTYIFTATDNSGCTATRTAVVNQPTLTLSLGNPVVSNVKCNGGTDGRIVASAVGGTGTISYSLTPSLGTQTPIGTFNNLTAQTYTLTATDINACRTAKTIPITQPTTLTSVLTKTDVSSCLPTNGSAVATVSGGTAPYSYLWSNNARTQTATNLTAGTYKLTIIDASGCTQNATTTINSLVDSLSDPSVIATYIGIDSIIFSWTAVPNAIRYEVKVNKGNWIPAKNNLEHAVTGLKPFETVVFMVRAVSNSTSCSGKIGSIQEKTKKESCIGDLVDNIPNGFTPGSNGTNDFFDPQKYLYIAGCSDNVTATELYIYNRWGEILFKANPYEKWDGKSTSQQRVVPTGVYFYILIVNDNGVKKSVKGTLNVFAD